MRHVKIVEAAIPKWLICGMGLAATCPSVLIYSVVMLSLLVVGFTTPEELGRLFISYAMFPIERFIGQTG